MMPRSQIAVFDFGKKAQFVTVKGIVSELTYPQDIRYKRLSLLRAFIAIEIPHEIKTAIAAQTAGLQKETGHIVRWVATDNIHLTLKFLGEVSPSSLKLLSQTLHAECSQHNPFEVSVSNLGSFPNHRRPRVIWIGLNAPAELGRLQHKIETAAARLGYEMDEKPFSPHLTIGRVREQASAEEINHIHTTLEARNIGVLGSFNAGAVILFKSDLLPSGPVYTSLYTALLGSDQAEINTRLE
jgi:2'-5' RNA ligase